MRAVSLWQPWASLIALRAKRFETRSWSTSYRGPLLLHAAKRVMGRRGDRWTIGEFEVERDAAGYLLRGPSLAWPYRLPLGGVVARTNLTSVLPIVGHSDPTDASEPYVGWWTGTPSTLHIWEEDEAVEDITSDAPYGDYSPGRFAWALDGVLAIPKTVPMRGRQGLWTPTVDEFAAIDVLTEGTPDARLISANEADLAHLFETRALASERGAA